MEINKLLINLQSRPDRLKSFKERNGNDFTLIDGVINKQPFIGIAESHMNAIRHAKEKGWKKVLIMEDDCLFSSGAKDYMDTIFNHEYHPQDWDVLLGGVYHLKGSVDVNKHWQRIGEFCALHWYIVNERCYDKLLSFDGTNHYDRWVGTQGLRIFLPKKFFVIQQDGYSDNVQRVTDYNNTYLNKFEILK